MEDIIHFRTKFSHRESNGNRNRLTFGQSGEMTEIRSAFPLDDARDIVWKKSIGNTLYMKNRRGETSIDVVLLVHEGEYYDQSKIDTLERLKDIVKKSCEYNGENFSYARFDINSIPKKKDSLILLVTASLDLGDFEKMSATLFGSDVVFLLLHNTYEIRSVPNILFLSKSPTQRYFLEFNKRIREIEKIIHLSGKSNILLTNTDTISLKLNHFFKYRYG